MNGDFDAVRRAGQISGSNSRTLGQIACGCREQSSDALRLGESEVCSRHRKRCLRPSSNFSVRDSDGGHSNGKETGFSRMLKWETSVQ